jgi:hypothetical protein
MDKDQQLRLTEALRVFRQILRHSNHYKPRLDAPASTTLKSTRRLPNMDKGGRGRSTRTVRAAHRHSPRRSSSIIILIQMAIKRPRFSFEARFSQPTTER